VNKGVPSEENLAPASPDGVYRLGYAHKMKSRSEYVRPENLVAVRRETANYKRFGKLTNRRGE
jgi:hypothetical protein